MKVERVASGIGTVLSLVILTSLCAISVGALVGSTGSATFGVVLKSLVVLALLAALLSAFIRWAGGGSSRVWLAVMGVTYVLTPAAWGGRLLFAAALGLPIGLAWLVDLAIWLALSWVVIRRVLPGATREDLSGLR